MVRNRLRTAWLAGVSVVALAGPAAAQLVASANDGKLRLVNGATVVAQPPAADSVTVLDLAASPPRIVAHVEAPASVLGPPLSVAITPDERLVLVTSNQRIDPANPARGVPDNRMSVIDLGAQPPRVVQTLETGLGPAGVSVNRAGTLALVANREEGTVSVFRIRGGQVEPVGKVEVANQAANVAHVAITPDGRHALVPRDGDHFINVLSIEGETVRRTERVFSAGLRPYGLAIAPDGRFAAVANIGRGNGDADTASLIDMSGPPETWRVVHTVTVGQTPEGIQVSPDGRLVAVTVMNGSNKPDGSPFRGPGLVRSWRVEGEGAGLRLVAAGEAQVGTWAQGLAFSRDGRRLVVGNMVERTLSVVAVAADGALGAGGPDVALPMGSAALRTAER